MPTMDLDNGTFPMNNMSIQKDNSFGCEVFPDHPDYCSVLIVCKRVAGGLSILGIMLTLTVIILLKKYREFTQRLIANLSIAALLFTISLIMSDFSSSSHGLCIVQSVFMTYSGWAVLLSAMLILLNLYCGIIFKKDMKRYEIVLTTLCWIVPILFAGLPLSADVYGPAGVWCWITNSWGWRFGIWYIWKFLSDAVFFLGIIHIWNKLLRSPDLTPAMREELQGDIRTLRMYPVVYFLMFLFQTINRIVNAISNEQGQTGYSFPLLLLHSISSPLFGAVVALVFVLDTKTRKMLCQKSIVDEIRKKWGKTGTVQEYYIPDTIRPNEINSQTGQA